MYIQCFLKSLIRIFYIVYEKVFFTLSQTKIILIHYFVSALCLVFPWVSLGRTTHYTAIC